MGTGGRRIPLVLYAIENPPTLVSLHQLLLNGRWSGARQTAMTLPRRVFLYHSVGECLLLENSVLVRADRSKKHPKLSVDNTQHMLKALGVNNRHRLQ